MSERMINLLLVKLKLLAILLLVALVSILLFSFTKSRTVADDIWKQLGLTKEQGTDGVKQSFLNGYLYYYGARNAKNIALNNRTAVVSDLLTYAKQYVDGATFKKEYDRIKKESKPEEPLQKAPNKEEIRKQKIAETEKSIKSTEETMKLSADMTKVLKPTLELLKKTLVDYKEPNNKTIDAYYLYEVNEQSRQMDSYQERLTSWEKEYPADYRVRIKERLQKFLDLSATVDFNAELKQVGNKRKFVNPAYEAKPYDWKQIYRAGKEVIEPARTFAQQWINELGN